MNVKLQWRKGFKQSNDKMFQDVQERVDKLCVERMTPYVPVAHSKYANAGQLRDTVRIAKPGKIIYTQRFAKRQYYEPYDHSKSGNPKGCRLWFEVMKSESKGLILREISSLVRKIK